MRVVSLHVHPVKSCAGMAIDAFEVTARGPHGDRRWMLIDDRGKFITARERPRLVCVRPVPVAGGLKIEAPGQAPLTVAEPRDEAPAVPVTIWKDRTTGGDAGDEAAAWFGDFLGSPCRLLFQRRADLRDISGRTGARRGDQVSFADGYPLLLIGTETLAALNERLARPVTMTRFRPNVVVETTDAFAEDAWKRVSIGGIDFDCAKRCSRCVLTTVDPTTGTRDADGEPLKTLRGFRFDREARGILFGMNLIPRGTGPLAVGDEVRATG